MVINIGMAKAGDWDYVRKDIAAVVAAAHPKAIVKVIIECCLLTDDEKVTACLAAKEAEKYGTVHIACDSSDRAHSYIPRELSLSGDASYFYYCANNTIYGTAWQSVPDTKGETIVCDMSSEILSKPVDVSKFGLIRCRYNRLFRFSPFRAPTPASLTDLPKSYISFLLT